MYYFLVLIFSLLFFGFVLFFSKKLVILLFLELFMIFCIFIYFLFFGFVNSSFIVLYYFCLFLVLDSVFGVSCLIMMGRNFNYFSSLYNNF